MKLKNVVKNITLKGKPDNREILHIAHDSRKVKNGTLFIAIAGEQNDGHDFIFDALDKGAVAVVANGRSPSTDLVPILQVKNPRKIMSKIAANFFDNPSNNLNIIGITGTNGKTSTTTIINDILNNCNKNSSSLGTLGFSTPGGIVSTGFTTPESIDLHQILKTMRDGGIKYVPMEVSSHSIDMHRIDDIKFKIGIFTNLSSEHLDYHGTMENYFSSKLSFLKNIDKNSYAILNRDDIYYKKIIKNINCRYQTYGFNESSDLYVKDYTANINFTTVSLCYKSDIYKFKTSLIGKYNLYNLMASISACLVLNIDINKILNAITAIKQIPGRMEKLKTTNNNIVIVDYAHTPDAYSNLLSTISELSINKKIITVFGCGGDRDKNNRPMMTKIAEKYSNETIITTDNPRFENIDHIFEDMIKGFEKNKYRIIRNREKAIRRCIENNKNSIIVVLGKGIENYQIINNKKIPHSDIDIIKEYINENKNKR